MSFNIRQSTKGAFSASTSISQVVNVAQTPIYEPPENIDITSINTTSLTTNNIEGTSGYNNYQTLGTQNIVNPPANSLRVGGVNVSALNRRVRSSYGTAELCVNTWTTRFTNSDQQWSSICWSPELRIFCCVAFQTSMTSPDGITWTLGIAPDFISWSSVCWSAELGIFCAVANNGEGPAENGVMTSPDGLNWTQRTAPTSYWTSVCWAAELNLFCAVSLFEPQIITSSDGVTWTVRTPSNSSASLGAVCWSPDLALFCALGDFSSSIGVMTSPDGINWTTQTSPIGTNNWKSVCWSPELSLFCGITNQGDSEKVMTSPDGVNWTLRTTPSKNWRSVCWSPDVGLFTAVASSGGSERVITSPDGINWTLRPSPTFECVCVCWSPELSIFCSVLGNNFGDQIITSSIALPNSLSALKAPSSQVSITANGNVGIATATASEKLEVTGNILASGTITPFTGAHVTFNSQKMYTVDDIGKLVSSTGYVPFISIHNAWPETELSNKDSDSAVYGILGEVRSDRVLVNGVGEGAIWVCDAGGSIQKGDLITTSTVTGYGQKQDNRHIQSHTAARAVMNCEFDSSATKAVFKEETGTEEEESIDVIPAYEIRYVDADGITISLEEYNELKVVNKIAHVCAFIACVYLCG